MNLSSPESAYSTGYSTDGTSPGTSYPPEYYINIRTGTHYFQSTANANANANAGIAALIGNYTNNNNNNNNNNKNKNNNSSSSSSGGGSGTKYSNNNNSNNARPKKAIEPSGLSSVAAAASLLSRRGRHGRFEDNAEPSASGSSSAFSSATITMSNNESAKDVARANKYGTSSKVRTTRVARESFVCKETRCRDYLVSSSSSSFFLR